MKIIDYPVMLLGIVFMILPEFVYHYVLDFIDWLGEIVNE